jgi:type III restriction enzyme
LPHEKMILFLIPLQYCKHATEHAGENGGKPWRYLLIPHTEVLPNMSMSYFAERGEFAG